MNKEKIGIVMIIIGLLVLGWLAGWLTNGNNGSDPRKYDGFSLRNWNRSNVDEFLNEKDSRGDWVCVNVEGMKYKRAVEVCQHEVGHEIFAEICEKDVETCFELVEEMDKESGEIK